MVFTTRTMRRRGTIVSLMALTLVALIGFLGLAIDLGMLAIAKTQAQNAADLAALTAARTLNGNPTGTYNNAAATTNAQNVLTYNYILGQSIQSSQLTLTYGSYDYNQSTQTFNANFPPTSGVPYTAVAATVTSNSLPGAFSKVFGSSFLPNVSSTAQAVHRPRDVALVMDLSGSMRFGTCLGFDFYTNSRTTNNPDSAFPSFGHYSSGNANMQGPSTNSTSGDDNYTITPSNTTVGNSSYTRTYVNNFYSNAAYATTLIRAFDSYTSTDGGNTWTAPSAGTTPAIPPASYTSVPGGDRPLYTNGSVSTFAQEADDVLNGTARNQWWELDGYSNCTNGSWNGNTYLSTSSYPSGVNGTGQSVAGAFNGYTKGPGYYGKTFFIWPPDPRRPLNTGSATAWSSTATDISTILQFLQDFGYTSALTDADFTTTQSASITIAGTSLSVSSSSGFPSTPFAIKVQSEVMSVTKVVGTTWTVTRAQQGTSAATHNNGTTVSLLTSPALYGLFTAANTTAPPIGKTPATSQTWPWPSGDTGSGATAGTLSNYLTNNVYAPKSVASPARFLLTTDQVFMNIMRLYNWDYVSAPGAPAHTACDWRIRFFGSNDNTQIFNGSGHLNPPGSAGTFTAIQTYNAILSWIAQSTDPFPTQLRAGRVKYYGSIPASITGSYPNWGNTDQQFWVQFMNYAMGYFQNGASSYQDISAMVGYGSDFTWGSVSLNSPPGSPAGATQYMTYSDIPARPRLRHWFGPVNMVDMLQNYNLNENVGSAYFMQPGDSYEAPLYTGKEAFQAAVDTMQNNHPNDWMTLAFYSWPRTSWSDTSGRLSGVACPLGTNYAYAKAALYFPFSTINADGTCNNTEITPYDADPATSLVPSAAFMDTPRADGDTCFAMGLMLAYNQFAVTPSSDTTLRTFTTNTPITFPTGMAGGLGRKGAQKVIIFETDGLANCSATASLVSGGSYNYYQIRYDMNRPKSSEYPSISASFINDPTVLSQVYSIVDQLKTDYGSTRNPFRLYTLGFGPVFSGVDASSALSTLQTMQFHAGTQNSAATALPSNQIITGTDANMSSDMVAAFTNILQNGVQIALIK